MSLTLSVANKNSQTKKVELSEVVFGENFKEALIHQAVTTCLTNLRSGTKAQKTRAQVRGGGAKPWRQKGTGRARAGTIRSPLWRGGGIVFAATPRDFDVKINKKMYRGAMRSILSELLRQDRIVLVDDINLNSHKTKELLGQLNELKLEQVLIVTNTIDNNLYLASRNLPHVDICEISEVTPVDLVSAKKVLFTIAAIKQLEERLLS